MVLHFSTDVTVAVKNCVIHSNTTALGSDEKILLCQLILNIMYIDVIFYFTNMDNQRATNTYTMYSKVLFDF